MASLLNCVLLRVHVSTCLAYQRALHTYVLTCQRALRAYLLTCQRVLRAHVLTCQRVLRVYVLTCSRAITTNDKDKFSITCFPYIFVIVLGYMFSVNFCNCLFPVKWKLWYILTSQKLLMGVYDHLCKMKWFDFCLSITLRVMFTWLIKVERLIIMYAS